MGDEYIQFEDLQQRLREVPKDSRIKLTASVVEGKVDFYDLAVFDRRELAVVTAEIAKPEGTKEVYASVVEIGMHPRFLGKRGTVQGEVILSDSAFFSAYCIMRNLIEDRGQSGEVNLNGLGLSDAKKQKELLHTEALECRLTGKIPDRLLAQQVPNALPTSEGQRPSKQIEYEAGKNS